MSRDCEEDGDSRSATLSTTNPVECEPTAAVSYSLGKAEILDFTIFPTGSFKWLVVLAQLEALSIKGVNLEDAVATASTGNHGAALLVAAKPRGTPATVYVPTTASEAKISRLRENGRTILVDGTFADATRAARETGLHFIEAFNSSEGCEGIAKGTVPALSALAARRGGPFRLCIPIGGGGLAAGILTAASRAGLSVQAVVLVEAVNCASATAAATADGPQRVAASASAADALGVDMVGEYAWSTILEAVRSLRATLEVVAADEPTVAACHNHLKELTNEYWEPSSALSALPTLRGRQPGLIDVWVRSGSNGGQT